MVGYLVGVSGFQLSSDLDRIDKKKADEDAETWSLLSFSFFQLQAGGALLTLLEKGVCTTDSSSL